MIKQYKQLIIGLILGLLIGGTVTFMYDQYQNVAVNGIDDTLNSQDIKNFTFTNYSVYQDGNTTKILGEIKNNLQKKRTIKFNADIVDDGKSLGTTNEVSLDIDAGSNKAFLLIVNKPIGDYTDVTFQVFSE